MRVWVAAFLALILSGCATIFEGLHQNVMVVTNPSGATCDFTREGKSIGTISNTPGEIRVRKDKHNVIISCTKAGYQETAFLDHSGYSKAIAGNVAMDLLFTAGVSSIVDSAVGSDNSYKTAVTITLLPDQTGGGVVTAATAGTSPPAASSAAEDADGAKQSPPR